MVAVVVVGVDFPPLLFLEGTVTLRVTVAVSAPPPAAAAAVFVEDDPRALPSCVALCCSCFSDCCFFLEAVCGCFLLISLSLCFVKGT